MSRDTPSAWSNLRVPFRPARAARITTCPECHDAVATRDGHIAGHYVTGRVMCSGSNTPVPPTEGETP